MCLTGGGLLPWFPADPSTKPGERGFRSPAGAERKAREGAGSVPGHSAPPRVTRVDFEEQARGLLPEHVSAYYGATAGSGGGSAEGIADWSAVRFRPRALRDLSSIDLSTTVLGTPVRTPVLVAPMAHQHAADPDAEVATGR